MSPRTPPPWLRHLTRFHLQKRLARESYQQPFGYYVQMQKGANAKTTRSEIKPANFRSLAGALPTELWPLRKINSLTCILIK